MPQLILYLFPYRMAHLNTIMAVKLEVDSYSTAHSLVSQLPSIVSVGKLIIRCVVPTDLLAYLYTGSWIVWQKIPYPEAVFVCFLIFFASPSSRQRFCYWYRTIDQCFGSGSGIGSAFDGRLDPDPDPGGLKRKETTHPKGRYCN
jgi:hypothetical protein